MVCFLQDIQIEALLMRACEPIIQTFCHVSTQYQYPWERKLWERLDLNILAVLSAFQR